MRSFVKGSSKGFYEGVRAFSGFGDFALGANDS